MQKGGEGGGGGGYGLKLKKEKVRNKKKKKRESRKLRENEGLVLPRGSIIEHFWFITKEEIIN